MIVQTCDAFSDCWGPFFQLWARYWPDCPYEVVLSTESKEYQHPSLKITCFTSKSHGIESPDWSDRLLGCLDFVQTPYVFHIQEDYFLQAKVDGRLICEALSLMESEGWAHVGLTHFGPRGTLRPTSHAWLNETPPGRAYRVNTQAALWDRVQYKKVLRPGESCWQFEILGTWRERGSGRRFANVAPERARVSPVVDYTATGILKGCWHPAIPRLFAAEGIPMDFSIRGMHKPTSRLASKLGIAYRLCQSPRKAISAWLLGN